MIPIHLLPFVVFVPLAGTQRYETFRRFYGKLTSGPPSFDDVTVSDCKYTVIRGFLKETCMIDSKPYFKCPLSESYYRVLTEQCKEQQFTHLCEDDPSFYQSCGHFVCNPTLYDHAVGGIGVCGDIVCQLPPGVSNNPAYKDIGNFRNMIVSRALSKYRCDNISLCVNEIGGVAVDERQCFRTGEYFSCTTNDKFTETVGLENVCDGMCDCSANCFDEASCFNISVGMNCHSYVRGKGLMAMVYIPPWKICDGFKNCANGQDEQECETGEVCELYGYYLRSRSLNRWNKCTVLSHVFYRKICDDYHDQMNCTHGAYSKISPLVCEVGGYMTTLSDYVICKNLSLCDDNIDNDCVNLGYSCTVHKHRMCDGFKECPLPYDESCSQICLDVVPDFSCVRRLSSRNESLPLPQAWVLDRTQDCLNGVDEHIDIWERKCGTGSKNLYVMKGNNKLCSTDFVFLHCPKGEDRQLYIDDVCVDSSNCDSPMCLVSRDSHQVKNQEFVSTIPSKNLGYVSLFICHSGLGNLQQLIGLCEVFQIEKSIEIMGIGKASMRKIISNRQYAASLDCREIFGELYIYMLCTNQCKYSSECLLDEFIPHTSCTNYPPEQIVITINGNGFLTAILRNGDGTFHQNVFSCKNEKCIPLHKVCDLADDCGDASDEERCSNNFRCNSGEFIPLSRMCNGNFDCLDFSDECNTYCNNQVKIFSHLTLCMAAWITGGIAVVLNGYIIIRNLTSLKKHKTSVAKTNNCLVTVISIGDFLQGMFLLLVAVADQFINKSTCSTQFKWTTSSTCNNLGVMSTTGSLISLLSMTSLSIKRAVKARSMLRPKEELSTKATVCLALEIVGIFAVAIFLATAPLFPLLDEYFVESLAYENNLFVGNVDRTKHMRIIEAYYGRFLKMGDSWKTIRLLVSDMFCNGKIQGKKISFYGRNGFCLFNYFIRKEDRAKLFTAGVLLIYLVCVLMIAVSYLFVNILTFNSSAMAGATNKALVKRNKTIQQKVAIMISTDILSWIPFLTISLAHFSEMLNAAEWYSVFSIIILPCNCIINPILILEDDMHSVVTVIWERCKRGTKVDKPQDKNHNAYRPN